MQPSNAGQTGKKRLLFERSELVWQRCAGKVRVANPNHRVAFFLGTFSWPHKKKYLARQ